MNTDKEGMSREGASTLRRFHFQSASFHLRNAMAEAVEEKDIDLFIKKLSQECIGSDDDADQIGTKLGVDPTVIVQVLFYCNSDKGSTINDLGGGRGKIDDGFIFPTGMPFENSISSF